MRISTGAVAILAVLTAGSAAGADTARPKMRVHLGVEPPALPGQVVPVEIRLLDDAGRPIDAPLTLDVDVGKATPPARSEPGVYRSTITIPRRLPSTRSVLVLARSGQSSVETNLDLAPGPAVTVDVEGPAVCPEDAEACRLDVSAEDADGNPAAEVPFGKAELGRLLPAGWAEPGRWVIVYQPPRVDRETTDHVVVELGTLRATHDLRLLPSRTRLGFAPVLGYVRQEGHSGFAASAQALGARRVGGGWLIGAGLEVDWWTVSHSGTESGLGVSTDRSQFGAGLLLQAERSYANALTTTFTLGGGAVRVSSTSHVEGQPGVTDAGWAPMASLSAGLGYRFGFGMPFVELRQGWVGDAHLLTDPGAKWPLFTQVGFRLDVR
jgi:hypothetical protein